ncbi:Uncharacterized protein conserved in bacteria [Sebaldella termitidis]|uniref:Pentapeptide repeat protein n=1 Tax=Sebaldella termitidis (strain ATCC 33386 / NCTC 11300) TaxID=526218 RepID=D1AHH9_SEBTE|nr:pentapeptide repeat-containing protein [Sebaldella termitidis]ACZ08213.1 pentapeptide repeat protein [Sebaldella termitidis ATCC 33386]SUI23516.1 Uncharacterized protein conserved in bacteria [Sebaldella termitidis]
MRIYTNSDEAILNLDIISLESQNIKGINFHRAFLDKIKIKKTFVENSDFRNAIFNDTIIINSSFKDSVFIMSEFENVRISNSNFENCKMRFSNFQNSLITDTYFKSSDMKTANFKNTILFNTIFENIENSQSINFDNAYYNIKTQLPKGVDPKEKKMLFIDNEIDEKYIIIKKEFNNNKSYDEKHPLREFDIFVKNNLNNLNKDDNNSFLLHLILSNIILQYKVIFKDFADRTDKFIKNRNTYLKDYSNKNREKIKLLIENYNENIQLSRKY